MRPSILVFALLMFSACFGNTTFAQDAGPAIAQAADEVAAAEVEASGLDELIHKLRQGGMTVVIQILLSVFGFAVALERLVHLRGKVLVPPALVTQLDRLWKQGKYNELIQTAQKDGSLLGKVMEEVVRHRTAGHQVASRLAEDVAAREIRRHLQRLFPIALVATLEPLLGLLGTILGMIGAFETVAVAGSMGDASLLADDIAKALVTTAVGLIIAIPAVFVHQYLKSQIGFGSATLDQAASGLISDWMILGPEDEQPPVTPKPTAPPAAPPAEAIAGKGN
jgi:biopolymer transport protein ExbB